MGSLGEDVATGGLKGVSSIPVVVLRLEKLLDVSIDHWENKEVEKFSKETFNKTIKCVRKVSTYRFYGNYRQNSNRK